MKLTAAEKITARLQQPGASRFSVEIMPVAGASVPENLQLYNGLLQLNPLFVDIPFHPQRQKRGFSAGNPSVLAPSSEDLAEALQTGYNLPGLVHLLCRGFTPAQTETALLRLHALGIRNVLLLRGDNPAEGTGHEFAYQLAEQVKKMNQGLNWKNEPLHCKTDFCVGVAGYPEPASQGVTLEQRIQFLKQKVAAGADFILTQLFFDNTRFFAFEQACRAAGITIPIIPGICPLTSERLLKMLPGFLQVSLPEVLGKELDRPLSKERLSQIGLAWSIGQVKELYRHKVPCVHFFALAEPVCIEKILKRVL